MSTNASQIPILTIKPDRVSIEVKALQKILEKVGNNPFAFYSINGPKRTGKSFMLSNFLRYLRRSGDDASWLIGQIREQAFEWKGGADRMTMGINVWSEPFWLNSNGRRVALLLMDTQGSFDDETTLQQNALVFTISTLLSSVLIFNIMQDVREDVLQFLQFFSSYATLTIPEDTDNQNSGGAFQKFVLLIRDWQFISTHQYGYYDDKTMPAGQARNFKIEKLNTNPDQPPEVKFTHDLIIKSFQDIGVYLMPEPGKDLKFKDSVEKLDEEFVEHVGTFVRLMLSPDKIVTKKIGGVEVSGTDMINYIRAWAQLFEGNDLPEVKSIYHSAAQSQYIMAKYMAMTYYTTEMQKYLGVNQDGVDNTKFEAKHSMTKEEAKKIYQGRSKLGGKDYERKFDEEFTVDTNLLFGTFKNTNHANLKATNIKKEMEAKHEKLNEEIKKTKGQMNNLKIQHETQLEKMRKDVEEGRRKYSDLEDMIHDHEVEQEKIKDQLEAKEAEIERLRVEAEEARKEMETSEHTKVFEIIGEVVDDILLMRPLRRAIGTAGGCCIM